MRWLSYSIPLRRSHKIWEHQLSSSIQYRYHSNTTSYTCFTVCFAAITFHTCPTYTPTFEGNKEKRHPGRKISPRVVIHPSCSLPAIWWHSLFHANDGIRDGGWTASVMTAREDFTLCFQKTFFIVARLTPLVQFEPFSLTYSPCSIVATWWRKIIRLSPPASGFEL